MISLCGYNLLGDINNIDPTPPKINNINNTKLSNGVYDNITITSDVTSAYSTDKTSWDYDTILSCEFNNTINGGNIGYITSQISALRLKRRKVGTNTWTKIMKDIPVDGVSDLSFSLLDYFNQGNAEYEYAIIPILQGMEGEYIVNKINTNFCGVFIGDTDGLIRLYEGVSYGSTTSVQSIGQLQPIGRKYPIIIKNSSIDYKVGSVNGMVLNDNFETTRKVDRKEIVNRVANIDKFLKNGKPKIIKDWNGNCWLVAITNSPQIDYNNNYGMGICNIGFEWTEQGDVNNEEDLIANGMIKEVK